MWCPTRWFPCTWSAPREKRPRSRIARTWIALLSAILAGCATPSPSLHAPAGEAARTVYVVRHGWHTGVMLNTADVSDRSWSILRDFPEARYLEVGWGDRDYYAAREPGTWLGIKALFWPTPGTLHVVGFGGTVEEFAARTDAVALSFTPSAFERLYLRVRASFDLDGDGDAIVLGPGLYGDSRFYASRESFSLLKTCNTWTAQVLREAGVPLSPSFAWSATGLLRRLRAQCAGPQGRRARPYLGRRRPTRGQSVEPGTTSTSQSAVRARCAVTLPAIEPSTTERPCLPSTSKSGPVLSTSSSSARMG
jgi:uncharacterized protein (TIGR02117 family)